MRYLNQKRRFDVLVSATALVVLAPLFLMLAVLIKLDSHGPVFFKQQRVGRDETLFWIYKFRTMRDDTPNDVPTHLFNESTKHITPIGGFLRKTSLDELLSIEMDRWRAWLRCMRRLPNVSDRAL